MIEFIDALPCRYSKYKQCAECGRTFVPHAGNMRYCSIECRERKHIRGIDMRMVERIADGLRDEVSIMNYRFTDSDMEGLKTMLEVM